MTDQHTMRAMMLSLSFRGSDIMNIREHYSNRIEEGSHLIPRYMFDGIKYYILDGRPTGSFLYALLSNDLFAAVERADDINQGYIVNWVKFLFNYAPAGCYGSPEKVLHWKGIQHA